MAKTAILVDGAFYRRRAYALWGDKQPENRANELANYAFKHIEKPDGPFLRELYRVFYYDCPPIETSVYHPYLKRNINMKKEPTYAWTTAFFESLKSKRKFALRMGRISTASIGYEMRRDTAKKLCSRSISVDDLTERDFHPSWKQKGVDMMLGLDISSLAYEGIVNQIILISGDGDFVPAAKVARRKGIDFILDPMGANIPTDLFEHVDGMESFLRTDPENPDKKFGGKPKK